MNTKAQKDVEPGRNLQEIRATIGRNESQSGHEN